MEGRNLKLTKNLGLFIILSILVAIYSTRINTSPVRSIENNLSEIEPEDIYYSEISNFYHFNQIEDDPELISTKSNSSIDFSYSRGSSSLYATDLYHYQLVEQANSDFYMELTIDYSYTGITLAEFFVRLESYCSENGSIADNIGTSNHTEYSL